MIAKSFWLCQEDLLAVNVMTLSYSACCSAAGLLESAIMSAALL